MESSTEFLEGEKLKISSITEDNKLLLAKIIKVVGVLDKIEIYINEKIELQITELESVENMSVVTFNLFKTICQNLVTNQN